MTTPVPSPAELAIRQGLPELDLLVWDAPNIDMTLTNVTGRRPTSTTRPRYDQVANWFVADAGERNVEASVFTNYTDGTAINIRPWLEAVRAIGFAVFIKPKLDAEDDIDPDMLSHIQRVQTRARLRRLVVVSGDGRNFQEPVERLAERGVQVVVVSFNEVASWAAQSPLITFVDLEDIPGAFRAALDRIRLEHLPQQGAWLPATGDLRSTKAVKTEDELLDDLRTAS